MRLGAHASPPQAQLDGFKSRALRAEAPTVRHLYATHWRALDRSSSEVGGAPTLVLGGARLGPPGREQRLDSARVLDVLRATVVAATATQRGRLAPRPLCALEACLALVQAQAATAPAPAVVLLTLGAQPARGVPSAAHAGTWGLARAARAEAQLPLRCLDGSVRAALGRGASLTEPEAVLRAGAIIVPRLAHTSVADHGASAVCDIESHLVTGGTGGLGLLTARWLAQRGARSLALASRSGVLARDAVVEWEAVQASGAAASVEQCDAAEATDARRLVAASLSLAGVWHAAGVLADGVLPRQDARALARVFAPKAHGAWALVAASASAPLRACALFSSVAALLGGAAQANYAAANACLDALAGCRRTLGRAAVSVQWSAWAEVGMAARGAARERMAALEVGGGFVRIGLAQGLAALGVAVRPGGPAVLGVVPVAWSRLLGGGAAVPAFLSAFAPMAKEAPRGTAGVRVGAAASPSPAVSLEAVLEMARRSAGGAVDADAPLMEAGVDSLGAVELRNQLQRAAGEAVSLPSTVVFDHPTVRQLAAMLEPNTVTSSRSLAAVAPAEAASVAVASSQSLLPQCGLDARCTWRLSVCGCDMSGQVPGTRWEQNELTSAMAKTVPSMRHGGFLRDAQWFDNGFFGISAAEAAVMDPQQRLLLEHGYAALHGAGQRKQALMGSGTGVYVGVWACEYVEVLSSSPAGLSVFAASAATCSVVAGRVSFALGMLGPCVSFDTACSSGIVAGHAAMRALQCSECTDALAAGVNMIFSPAASMGMGGAGMTCADAI